MAGYPGTDCSCASDSSVNPSFSAAVATIVGILELAVMGARAPSGSLKDDDMSLQCIHRLSIYMMLQGACLLE